MTKYRPSTDGHVYRARYNPAFLKRVLKKREMEKCEQTLREEEAAAAASLAAEIEAEALVGQYRTAVALPSPSEAAEPIVLGTERLSAVQIIRHVAKAHGVLFHEITSSNRNRRLVAARHEAMYEVRIRRPDMSLPQIGKIFGGRDHTTVYHAIRKIEAQRAGGQR